MKTKLINTITLWTKWQHEFKISAKNTQILNRVYCAMFMNMSA